MDSTTVTIVALILGLLILVVLALLVLVIVKMVLSQSPSPPPVATSAGGAAPATAPKKGISMWIWLLWGAPIWLIFAALALLILLILAIAIILIAAAGVQGMLSLAEPEEPPAVVATEPAMPVLTTGVPRQMKARDYNTRFQNLARQTTSRFVVDVNHLSERQWNAATPNDPPYSVLAHTHSVDWLNLSRTNFHRERGQLGKTGTVLVANLPPAVPAWVLPLRTQIEGYHPRTLRYDIKATLLQDVKVSLPEADGSLCDVVILDRVHRTLQPADMANPSLHAQNMYRLVPRLTRWSWNMVERSGSADFELPTTNWQTTEGPFLDISTNGEDNPALGFMHTAGLLQGVSIPLYLHIEVTPRSMGDKQGRPDTSFD